MSIVNCHNLFTKLKYAIDNVNLKIIDTMTDSDMSYENVCLKQDITCDYFFSELKKSWELIIDNFISQADKCPLPGESTKNFATKIYSAYQFSNSDSAIDFLLSENDSFVLNPDINTSLVNFIKVFKENCKCHKSDILAFLSKKYFQKYYPLYANDPEIKSYVSNKTNLIIDNLKKNADQIKLTDPDAILALDKLKDSLNLGTRNYIPSDEPQSRLNSAKKKVNMIGGGEKNNANQSIENIETALLQLTNVIKKNPIDNTQYGNLIDKMLFRIRLIPTELKIQSIKPKTNTSILTEFHDKISNNISKIDSKNPEIINIIKNLNTNVKSIENILSQPKMLHRSAQNEFYLLITNLNKLKLITMQKSYINFIDTIQSDLKLIQMDISKQTGGNTNVKMELHDTINRSMELIKEYFDDVNLNLTKNYYAKVIDGVADKLANIYSFSTGDELDKLIPDDLGSLKAFFVKVISKYYENLHPIIWVQIFRQMIDNFLIDLPRTSDEMFQFVSKYTLLNSGPFILKTLQMIRPVLSEEIATKYSLTKLSYPQLKTDEVNLILNKVIPNWTMYSILANYSASVGHVCLVSRVNEPEKLFIIKIIKLISIVQSCWEYKKLYAIYPEGSCERSFVQAIIKSNGRELNVINEIQNIDRGFENYTGTYADAFTSEIDAKITTIQNIPGIIKEDCWFALATTLAPGIPLNTLVESDLLKSDTKYRAKLHRCLDLLVYHFFLGIIKSGFYHGDLHSGNIFFSYTQSQITLIDFGSIGELDIFDSKTDTNTLLEIVIMSIFYNYDGILDTMTDLLNEKCVSSGEKINKQTSAYAEFKQTLRTHHLENIKTHNIYANKMEKYEEDIFGSKRIADENKRSVDTDPIAHTTHNSTLLRSNTLGLFANPLLFDTTSRKPPVNKHIAPDSIYSYLEFNQPEKEVVVEVENRDVLPEFTNVSEDGSKIGFTGILDLIIKFYAKSGINIAVKFTEFYEFQKAYVLLLGVLKKTGYGSYRISIVMKKALRNWKNIPQLLNLSTTVHAVKIYNRENTEYNKLAPK